MEKRNRSGEIWSDAEIAILKKLYPIASKEEIIKTLKRDWEGISKKANKLGLKRVIRGPGFSWIRDEAILRKVWNPQHSKEEIEKALSRHSWNAIKLHAALLGLPPRGRVRIGQDGEVKLTEGERDLLNLLKRC